MSQPPNKIRIGLVGLNFGRNILNALHTGAGSRFFEIAAVCDLDAAKAKAQAAELGCQAYSKLDDLLADRSIPAIGLFTGPVSRAVLVRQIIRAGKDVMTTKPFELDPAAALDVLHEACRLKRVVHLNSPAPLLPADLAQIQTWREEYRLGRAVGCRADMWASYREEADGSWYDDPAKCPAAPVFRLGIYHINDLVRLFGEAERVTLLESRLFTQRPTTDNAQLGIRFVDGLLANIYASFCVGDGDTYRNSMTLNFEKGTIYRNCGTSNKLALVMAEGDQRRVVEEVAPSGRSGEYQWEAFHLAGHGERLENEVTPEQIVAGIRVVRAMAEAAQGNGVAAVKS